ncbi:type II toxin-antitoxin system RelE/ParE family toxin [Mucilaginibacter mali]|uniref:Type II toxin-antitoxin system RelE/ParE family toxin n=1 Tax=Mucilaginibacter mali TaxID=2740462 RepID=A0A7D4TR64_9SPHI|nr:type II toxin-antitoxin system RelE/ParE family toxin [Mucilaginibacter mali]
MRVNWSKAALSQLEKALDFISGQGFIDYAIEVEDGIVSRIENLPENYNIYPIDKYKNGNDGSFRAFEFNEYRVSYRIKKSEIKILRIRHTSRKPLNY